MFKHEALIILGVLSFMKSALHDGSETHPLREAGFDDGCL